MPSPSPERNLAQALQEGRCRDPFSHLGPHQDGAAGDWVIRAFLPGATMVTALADADGAVRVELTDPDGTGLFIGRLASATRPRYRLAVAFGQQHYTLEDPYRFGPWLGDLDVWLLAEGQHLRPWQPYAKDRRSMRLQAGLADLAHQRRRTAPIVRSHHQA